MPMLTGLKYLFNHSLKDIEVNRIVDSEFKRMQTLMNGDSNAWPKWAQKEFRLRTESNARREVDQRQTLDLLIAGMTGGAALIVFEIVSRLG